MICAIGAEISALALARESTASSIIRAKNSAEEEQHHRELENIANGSGKNDSVNILRNNYNLQIIVPFIIAGLPNIIIPMPEAELK